MPSFENLAPAEIQRWAAIVGGSAAALVAGAYYGARAARKVVARAETWLTGVIGRLTDEKLQPIVGSPERVEARKDHDPMADVAEETRDRLGEMRDTLSRIDERQNLLQKDLVGVRSDLGGYGTRLQDVERDTRDLQATVRGHGRRISDIENRLRMKRRADTSSGSWPAPSTEGQEGP